MARPRVTGPLMMIGACVLTLAPWLIRDAIVMHRFTPISDETGITLAGTYNPASAAADPPYNWIYLPADPRRRGHQELGEPDV